MRSPVWLSGAGRHQRDRDGGPVRPSAPDGVSRATLQAERPDDAELGRDRIIALIVEAMIVFVPCMLWFVYYNRQLSVCGSAIPDTATQCSGVGVRFLASLAGLIASGVVTVGAAAALVVRRTRSRR